MSRCSAQIVEAQPTGSLRGDLSHRLSIGREVCRALVARSIRPDSPKLLFSERDDLAEQPGADQRRPPDLATEVAPASIRPRGLPTAPLKRRRRGRGRPARQLAASAGWWAAASLPFFAIQIYYDRIDEILDGRAAGFAYLMLAGLLLTVAISRARRNPCGGGAESGRWLGATVPRGEASA